MYVTDAADLVVDINGYFSPPVVGAYSFYPVTPCRISDTRNAAGAYGGPRMTAAQTRQWSIVNSACGIPASAKSFAVNATVVPAAQLSFLTLWPSDLAQPLVSTLNAGDGSIVANAAIVPASANGSIRAFPRRDVSQGINRHHRLIDPCHHCWCNRTACPSLSRAIRVDLQLIDAQLSKGDYS